MEALAIDAADAEVLGLPTAKLRLRRALDAHQRDEPIAELAEGRLSNGQQLRQAVKSMHRRRFIGRPQRGQSVDVGRANDVEGEPPSFTLCPRWAPLTPIGMRFVLPPRAHEGRRRNSWRLQR